MKDNSIGSNVPLTQTESLINTINDRINGLNQKCDLNVAQFDIATNSSYQMILKQFDNMTAEEILKGLSLSILSIQTKIKLLHASISSNQIQTKAIQNEYDLNQLIASYQQKDVEMLQLTNERDEQEHLLTELKEEARVNNKSLEETISAIGEMINEAKAAQGEINELDVTNENKDILFLREKYIESIENELKQNKEIDVQQYKKRLEFESQAVIHQLSHITDKENQQSSNIDYRDKCIEQSDNDINDLLQEELLEQINELKLKKQKLIRRIEEEKERINKEVLKQSSKSSDLFSKTKENKNAFNNRSILFLLIGFNIALAFIICKTIFY